MTNQQIFDLLSELEAFFYYKRDYINPSLDEAHEHIKKALLIWHEYTGCTNYGSEEENV